MDISWATSLEDVADQKSPAVKDALHAALRAAERYPAEFCGNNIQLRVRVLGMFVKTHAAMGVELKEITEVTRKKLVATVDTWALENGVDLNN